MPQMISYGGELIRISPKDSKKLEYSKNNGLSWNARCGGSGNYGKFIDLMDNGKEILATTEKGLCNFIYGKGYDMWLENAKSIKDASGLRRLKSDRADASMV